MQQKLSDFMASLEKRLAPLDPVPAKLEKLEARVATLEATEQRAQGAVWLGRVLLLGVGGVAAWVLNHITR